MKTTPYRNIKRQMDERMTSAERAIYELAYEQAGASLRLAELFYDVRTDAGMTQTELARRMGTSQPVIARIEGGGSIPTIAMLERLARATGRRLQITLPVAS